MSCYLLLVSVQEQEKKRSNISPPTPTPTLAFTNESANVASSENDAGVPSSPFRLSTQQAETKSPIHLLSSTRVRALPRQNASVMVSTTGSQAARAAAKTALTQRRSSKHSSAHLGVVSRATTRARLWCFNGRAGKPAAPGSPPSARFTRRSRLVKSLGALLRRPPGSGSSVFVLAGSGEKGGR